MRQTNVYTRQFEERVFANSDCKMPKVCTAGTLMYAGTADHNFVLFNMMMMMMMMMMGMQITDCAAGEDSEPLLSPKDIGIITPYARQAG